MNIKKQIEQIDTEAARKIRRHASKIVKIKEKAYLNVHYLQHRCKHKIDKFCMLQDTCCKCGKYLG